MTEPTPQTPPPTREEIEIRLRALSKTRITELRADAINAARSLPAKMTWAEIAKALDMTPQGVTRMKGVKPTLGFEPDDESRAAFTNWLHRKGETLEARLAAAMQALVDDHYKHITNKNIAEAAIKKAKAAQ